MHSLIYFLYRIAFSKRGTCLLVSGCDTQTKRENVLIQIVGVSMNNLKVFDVKLSVELKYNHKNNHKILLNLEKYC